MRDRRVKLELIGSFRLVAPNGKLIAIAGKHGPALLAILATSRNHERSREVLKAMLWPRSPEPQCSASLRSLLTALRQALGSYAATLESDRKSVRLKDVDILDASDGGQEFYEDAPTLGEVFEDWLSRERARVRNEVSNRKTALCLTEAKVVRTRICVAFYPPNLHTDDTYAMLIANRVCEQVMQHMCMLDMVDVLDLTVLDGSGTGAPIRPDQQTPDLALQVSLSKVDSFAELGIRVFDPQTRKVFWSASISADQATTFLFSPDQLEEFANQAADSVHMAILRRLEIVGMRPLARPGSMFGAVHQVLGMSVCGQDMARSFFREQVEFQNSSVAAAWYAFSLANTVGESGDAQHVAEEAAAYCRRAVELDQANALSLALVAHVQGFVLRRLDIGAECAAMARRIAPNLAIGWDLSAMNALYRGALSDAARYSATAVRLSRFSPYKPLFLSSQSITASVRGEHRLAISSARQVLDRIPTFLAVKRHLTGSLAATGQISESRALVSEIRQRDPLFAPDMLDDPSYPLPSPESIDLIRNGFLTIGLNS